MEAAKLMLRNLFIEKNSGEIIQVIGLKEFPSTGKSSEIEFSGFFEDGWQAVPIPIKDTLLFELGFKKNGPMYYHFIKKFKIFKNKDIGYHYWDQRKSEEPIKLIFIHELQNAYFYFRDEHLEHTLTGRFIGK